MLAKDHDECAFYRVFFEKLPISLWHFDLSAIRQDFLDMMAGSGTGASVVSGAGAESGPHAMPSLAAVPSPAAMPSPAAVRAMMAKVRLLGVNAATLALYEAPDAVTLAARLDQIIPEEAFPALFAGTKALFGSQGSFMVETWNRTLGGKRVDVRLHLFSEGAIDGVDAGHVLMAVDDLSSLHSLDERLKLLSTLPEANPDMVIIMDCEARLLYLNPKTRSWLAARGLMGDDAIFSLLPPEYQHHECGTCDRESERQSTFRHEDRHYRLKIRPFPGQNRCMITISDVTDLTQMKEERELFSEAMQSSSRPIIISDHTGVMLHANRAFEQLYGYPVEEVRGQNPRLLNPGREVYRDMGYSDQAYDELFAGMWKAALDPAIARWEGDVINQAKDGRILWVHLTLSGVRCEEGFISHFIAMPVDITEQRNNEQTARLELYRTIASVAEMRDNETGHHMLRVGAYTRLLASAIGMNAKFASDMEAFAPLHDLGKVGITDDILLARRKLTDSEFDIMRTHAVLGHQILADKKGLELADEICWCHHERWDGTGYPRGLEGEAIPVSARITSIADVYDALRNERPYKPAWTHEATVREMAAGAGTRFDPALIKAFLSKEMDFEAVYSNPQYEDKET